MRFVNEILIELFPGSSLWPSSQRLTGGSNTWTTTFRVATTLGCRLGCQVRWGGGHQTGGMECQLHTSSRVSVDSRQTRAFVEINHEISAFNFNTGGYQGMSLRLNRCWVSVCVFQEWRDYYQDVLVARTCTSPVERLLPFQQLMFMNQVIQGCSFSKAVRFVDSWNWLPNFFGSWLSHGNWYTFFCSVSFPRESWLLLSPSRRYLC